MKIMTKVLPSVLCSAVLLCVSTKQAEAWWPQGHSILSAAAVRSLPKEVPAFFRGGAGMIAHATQDPDVSKNRDAPMVSDRESPEHYIDLELLQGRALPPTRHEFLKLCAEMNLEPKDVGYLPYSIAEWTERLSIAFAEYRKYPANPYIRNKCLVYAGFLAHYAQDMCMPLHVTVHHDGRANPDGSSPKTGIHASVDSLIEKLNMQPARLAANQRIVAVSALLPAVVQELEQSRTRIDLTYQLESQFPPESGAWKATPEVKAFAEERARESTRFTASLFLTAWRNSARIKLPQWLRREAPTKAADTRAVIKP
ncbi:MAG TPA: hypothetical protein VF600_19000 [Abditibacteriaceae bacterium]|jgi:hypothetical protein